MLLLVTVPIIVILTIIAIVTSIKQIDEDVEAEKLFTVSIQMMDSAFVYYQKHNTYKGFQPPESLILDDSIGNKKVWWEFFSYPHLFGGTYNVKDTRVCQQPFFVNWKNDRTYGKIPEDEICGDGIDNDYNGIIDNGCN